MSLEYFLNGYRCSSSGPHDGGVLSVASPAPDPGYILQTIVSTDRAVMHVSKLVIVCSVYAVVGICVVVGIW